MTANITQNSNDNKMVSSTLSPTKDYQKVSFCRKVSYKRIPRLCDYTDEEIKRIWISKFDLELMRNSFRQTVALVVNGQLTADNDEHCLRGTDIGVPDVVLPRRQLKAAAVKAVIDKMGDLEFEDSVDAEKVREVYLQFSVDSGAKAARQGQMDAIDAGYPSIVDDEEPSSSNQVLKAIVRTKNKLLLTKEQVPPDEAESSSAVKKRQRNLVSIGPASPTCHFRARQVSTKRRVGQLIAVYEKGDSLKPTMPSPHLFRANTLWV